MGAVYLYRFNFFTGFIVSSTVYYLVCRIKPVPATSRVWCEKPDDDDYDDYNYDYNNAAAAAGAGAGAGVDRQFSAVYTEGQAYDEEQRSNVGRGGGFGGGLGHGQNNNLAAGGVGYPDREGKSAYSDNYKA